MWVSIECLQLVAYRSIKNFMVSFFHQNLLTPNITVKEMKIDSIRYTNLNFFLTAGLISSTRIAKARFPDFKGV